MLAILRKYQKSIFIVTTLVVISTFVFYGAVRANRGLVAHNKSFKENVLYQISDNEKVTDLKIQKMAQFLNEEVDQLSQVPMNMFNGQFVSSYLFEAGIGSTLGKEFFTEIKVPLQQKLQKMQNYEPYSHPAWPSMSAEKIWDIFAPDLAKAYKEFKSCKNPDAEMLAALQNLFVQSKQMPSSFLQQILTAYQNQNPNLPKDPGLYNQDLALFHGHSLNDWFGKEYLDLVSQFVINTAYAAKQKGISFSKGEVKASLLQNGINFIRTYGGKEVTPGQVESLLQTLCFQRQCTEKELLATWEQVLLCKSYLDQGDSIVFDPEFYQETMKDSAKRFKVILYQMPSEFQIKTTKDYARLESYLDAVFPEKTFAKGEWPKATLSLDSIKEESPELVYRKVVVNMAALTKEDVKFQISLKELWDYEMGDLGWKKVLSLVPAAKDVSQKVERYAFLKALSPEKKQEIDAACKNEMVNRNPLWISNLLEQTPLQEKTLIIPYETKNLPLLGFSSAEELLESLRAIKEPTVIAKDGEHFYKLAVMSMSEDEVMTYQEAVKEGTLDTLLERNLLSFFERERHKHSSLKNAQFDEVKDQIVELKYPIKGKFGQRFTDLLSASALGSLPLTPTTANPLISQFAVKEEVQTWSRTQHHIAQADEFWKLAPGDPPKAVEMKDGLFAVAKVQEVFEDQKAIEEAIEKGRHHLENVARKEKAESILSYMKEHHTYAMLNYE